MTYQAGLFNGKRALVAGGTQGIGAVIANHLAALGAQVTRGCTGREAYG